MNQRRSLLVAVILVVFAAVACNASDIYIAQNATGSNTGADCADAHAASWFNSTANWGSSAAQIGPGTTVHLCGTFTGIAGGSMLTVQASGTPASPIILFGETGATFTSPYWSSTGGAINTNGQSYITINGGPSCGWSGAKQTVTPCNMTIVDTQNGTNLPYKASSVGISIPSNSTFVTVENTDIHNIYQKVGKAVEDLANYTQQNCINLGWEGKGVKNITITNVICHDVGWGLSSGGPGPLTEGPGIEIYNADHDIDNAAGTLYLFGNHFHDWAIWDTPTGDFHHDGFHCYAGSAGASNVVYIYNNQFDGNSGSAGMNAYVFLEGSGSSSACFIPNATGAYIFNNVAAAGGWAASYFEEDGNSKGSDNGNLQNLFVANNTVIGNFPTDTGSVGAMAFNYANNFTFENNAIGGLPPLISQNSSYVTYAIAPNHNFWEDCSAELTCFAANGVSSPSFSKWQSAGFDLNGGANTALADYFGLGFKCTAGSVGQRCSPVTGSPLIQAGVNLSSVCKDQPNPGLGALCFDFTGAPRPATGAWDAGAYNYMRPSTPINVSGTPVVQQ
jgi:hypothetical protein